MGSNKSKQAKQAKAYGKNYSQRPVQTVPVIEPPPPPRPKSSEYKLPKKLVETIPKILPVYKSRRDKLYNPQSKRPLELSWLQQGSKNDNYTY
ncbi:unnamed protein product [Adineta steineri]|uniref:Uncharacterized protein n=1 Tax=Adineta steineri TaxID=433720 RepID=A0A813SZ40_9BILA|nr:unnamed protein product [Adineta steineri]CAF0807369.1 unnamed protein product [Adineta steineri]CAF1044826.1 unnamed protein product [Adineta steineri]CAF3526215.1 unnamed protein product [Adineta steineri]CAF3609211.1 unnamed protein product [Adineta steineri]